MSEIKLKECADLICKNRFPQYNSLQKYCSWSCEMKNKKAIKNKPYKKIPNMSPKRKKETAIYLKNKILFLEKPENKFCFIDGCIKLSNTIEHRKGRKGFADQWAKDNNISLYLDERFWAGCCNDHNLELERNPELSKKYQLSKIHSGKKIKK